MHIVDLVTFTFTFILSKAPQNQSKTHPNKAYSTVFIMILTVIISLVDAQYCFCFSFTFVLLSLIPLFVFVYSSVYSCSWSFFLSHSYTIGLATIRFNVFYSKQKFSAMPCRVVPFHCIIYLYVNE